MSEPSPSTETAVDTGAGATSTSNPDQPDQPASGPPVRTPGTRTPRRVQWAAAVDEDEDDGDHHGLDTVNEDDGDRHELDQAGLDVCKFSFPLHFHSLFPFFTACCLPNTHSRPRTSPSLEFRRAASE